ncbi:MAG: BamA/TamA family outer membrane protein [Ignavibacteriae bacterium]|nr:BamA/TamA family outer membrane protein [Ignavibacteriota bacterium]
MIIRFILHNILFILTFANITFAQDQFITLTEIDSIQIDSISITGNDITEDFIILREINIEETEFVNNKILDFNQERIFSLGLFNKVKINLIDRSSFVEMNIEVAESWYIYPLPFLKLRDNTIARATYGLIVLYKNFRGRNETIKAVVTAGLDPTYGLSYYNPVLLTGSDLMLEIDMGYVTRRNRNLIAENAFGDSFDFRYILGSISLGYRFNLFHTVSQMTAFEYNELPNEVAHLSASKTNIDRILSLGAAYSFDSRNLKQFSDDGNFSTVLYTHKGFGINNISYNLFKADLRQYKSIVDGLSFKLRGVYRHTFGDQIPFYGLSLLGDIENIRGHKFRRREGNNYILTSFELNYPIVKEWNLSLDLPLLPKQLTSARIALFTNIFVDSGTTYNNGEPISLKRFDSGYGFGITLLILPYNAFRFEYAIDEFGQGEFLIESGFSF